MDSTLRLADVARSRRYAARVRISVAVLGGLILALDPATVTHPIPAAIGLAVIGLTGVIEILVRTERWLAIEEAFSCVAVILIVTWSGGEVNAITLLWLVAAATGVLARGGRVGSVGRILVVGALLAPLVLDGVSGERVGLAAGSILLLLAVGRISRETRRAAGQGPVRGPPRRAHRPALPLRLPRQRRGARRAGRAG